MIIGKRLALAERSRNWEGNSHLGKGEILVVVVKLKDGEMLVGNNEGGTGN